MGGRTWRCILRRRWILILRLTVLLEGLTIGEAVDSVDEDSALDVYLKNYPFEGRYSFACDSARSLRGPEDDESCRNECILVSKVNGDLGSKGVYKDELESLAASSFVNECHIKVNHHFKNIPVLSSSKAVYGDYSTSVTVDPYLLPWLDSPDELEEASIVLYAEGGFGSNEDGRRYVVGYGGSTPQENGSCNFETRDLGANEEKWERGVEFGPCYVDQMNPDDIIDWEGSDCAVDKPIKFTVRELKLKNIKDVLERHRMASYSTGFNKKKLSNFCLAFKGTELSNLRFAVINGKLRTFKINVGVVAAELLHKDQVETNDCQICQDEHNGYFCQTFISFPTTSDHFNPSPSGHPNLAYFSHEYACYLEPSLCPGAIKNCQDQLRTLKDES